MSRLALSSHLFINSLRRLFTSSKTIIFVVISEEEIHLKSIWWYLVRNWVAKSYFNRAPKYSDHSLLWHIWNIRKTFKGVQWFTLNNHVNQISPSKLSLDSEICSMSDFRVLTCFLYSAICIRCTLLSLSNLFFFFTKNKSVK